MIRPYPTNKPYASVIKDLYNGEVYLLQPNQLTLQIVSAVEESLHQKLGQNPRTAQFDHTAIDFFKKIGQLRKLFYTHSRYLNYLRALLSYYHWDPEQTVFDPMRLRTVQSGGHVNPAAKAIYHCHRDTWYANPTCQITWWIPLHDVQLNETFEFYPSYFSRAVQNNSGVFDHNSWTAQDKNKKIGWQDKDTGKEAIYPSLQQTIDRSGFGVSCPKGSLLLFSGQHLHATLKQSTGKTRFSIDFRTVSKPHFEQNIGPLNVDNASTGTSFNHHLPFV